MRTLLRGAVAALAGLALAGCAGLSGTGPVRAGLDVGSAEEPEIRQVFPGPQPGASQEAVVRGFIRAGAASDGAYDNARAFLTTAASESWNPDETLVLQDDDAAPTSEQVDPATIGLTIPVSGTVSSSGRYTPATPGATVRGEFGLTSVNGQWRIASLPEGFGRWIKSGDVARLVQPFDIHYVSTSRRATVPDVRWFPLDRLAARLARAQLEPVPDFLEGAATSAVPAGARLLGDAVSVRDGVASVNLISTSLAAGEETRRDLWAQFLTTLTQDPSVTSVSLQVDGVPVDLSGVVAPVSSLSRIGFEGATTPSLAAMPVVRRGSEVAVFDPRANAQDQDRSTPSTESDLPAVPPGYSRLALSADGSEMAAVDPDGDGVSRWRDGVRIEVPGLGDRLGSPAYDRRGYLWAGSVGPGSARLVVVDTRADPGTEGAEPTAVTADWLADRRVVEARVSPGGDRVAVLSTRPDGKGPRVDVAGVVRTDGDRPEALAAPLALGTPFSSLRGLVWLDDRTLATISSVRGGEARPTILSVGGEVTRLTALDGAEDVSTTGTDRNLYVVTDAGRLFVRAGPRWVDNGPADDLAAPAG